MDIVNIPLEKIIIPPKRVRNRRRDPGPLAQSIAKVGLINPITIADDYTLISGVHRLEAFRLLGRETIPAQVLSLDEMNTELVEIEENLTRYDLTVFEQSQHVARREELLAARGMRTPNHRPEKGSTVGPLKNNASLAAESGLSKSSYKYRKSIGTKIYPRAAEILEGIDDIEQCSLPDSTRQLVYLAGIDDEDEQADVALRVADGTARDVWEASKQLKREKVTPLPAARAPDGKFQVVVIDPPWPMQKIERQVRPNQFDFDYPTMSEDELRAFPLTSLCDDNCHLFMWTTQRFLPLALELMGAYGFRYVLTMVWHKAGGFQPVGLPQYNCEFVLYGRKGSPEFADTKRFPTCFTGDRREHSRKPDGFYELVERVTEGRRIDIFSRECRTGFEQYGNEIGKFSTGLLGDQSSAA